MDSQDNQRMLVYEKNVAPGYFYDFATGKSSYSKDAELINTEPQPVRYKFQTWSKDNLDSQQTIKETPLIKDYVSEKSLDAILIRGTKVSEIKDIKVPPDDVKYRVTSVYYQNSADFLVLFSQYVSKECLTEFKSFLFGVVNESDYKFLPKMIENNFQCAYIYPIFGEAGSRITTAIYAVNEFCRLLRDSQVSTVPVSVSLIAPNSKDTLPGSLERASQSAYNNKDRPDSCASVSISMDDVPQVHSEVNAEQEVCYNKEDITLKKGRDHGIKQMVSEEEYDSLNNIVERRKHELMCGRNSNTGDMTSNKGKGCVSSAINDSETITRGGYQEKVSRVGESIREQNSLQNYDMTPGKPQSKPRIDQKETCNTDNSNTNVENCTSNQQLKRRESEELIASKSNIINQKGISYHRNDQQKPKELQVGTSHQQFENKNTQTVDYTHNTKANYYYNNSQNSKCMKGSLSSLKKSHMSIHNLQESVNETSNVQVAKPSTEMSKSLPNLSCALEPLLYKEKYKGLKEAKQTNTSNETGQKAVGEGYNNDANPFDETKNDTNKDIRSGMVVPKEEHSSEYKLEKCNNRETKLKGQYPSEKNNQNGEKINVDYNEKDGKNESEYKLQENKEKNINVKAKRQDKDTCNMDTMQEPGKLLQNSQRNKHENLKQLSSVTSISEKEKISRHGISCDETDESLALLVPKQSTHDMKKNQKFLKEKLVQMTSTKLWPVHAISDPCGLERKYYGVVNDTYLEKVIIFLGATGSGKTMLINFIANFIMGKKKPDDKLVHVEDTLPTSAITAYTFCSGNDEIPITIIDTPGLNDSTGTEVRDHVQSLKTFLANASSKGIQIHAVGFVAQAYLVRLTSSERLVMDYVSTMFGQSVSEHLITLVTFADNQDNPPVVEAMKNYGVKSKFFLKFNTSALNNTKSQEKDDQSDDLNKAYWRVCRRNWKKCLKIIKDLPPLSVKTMKALQSEIYETRVIESAERDLRAELNAFFTICRKEPYMSNDAIKVCEQIWELGTIVHRLRYTKDIMKCSLNSIITELSIKTCETLGISAERYICMLSLHPSGALVASGWEIIHAMAPFYEQAKQCHSDSEEVSKNITKWAYCRRCKKEHKMDRYDPGTFTMWRPPRHILSLKCSKCSCPGGSHTVSFVVSPFHYTKILEHTLCSLYNVISRHSLPGYCLQIRTLLQFLHRDQSCEHQEFVKDLLKRIS